MLSSAMSYRCEALHSQQKLLIRVCGLDSLVVPSHCLFAAGKPRSFVLCRPGYQSDVAEPLAGRGGGDVREPGGVAVHVSERHRRDGVRRPAGATAPGGQERYVRPSLINT